ncbi:TPA: hypothetical protein N0F65_012275, partial [Lagenidium giganteum]
TQPKEVAWFSKYDDNVVRFDRSNLLRYKPAQIGANLLDGIDTYESKDAQQLENATAQSPAPLKPFLAAVRHFHTMGSGLKTPHFLTYRNNLNKILGTPYNQSNAWTLCATKRNGCVYLDARRTDDDIESMRNLHINQTRGSYAGRRFEKLSTYPRTSESQQMADHMVVNEEEEYCGIFSLTLGSTRLLVAAEIDCKDSADTDQRYVELKTFRELVRDKDRYVFERFKLLAFWIQSYLVGIPKIVCAFRSDDFEIRKLQTFRTTEIPRFCRKYWDPKVCMAFAQQLLDWMYSHIEENKVYQVTYVPRAHVVEMTELPGSDQFLSDEDAVFTSPPVAIIREDDSTQSLKRF